MSPAPPVLAARRPHPRTRARPRRRTAALAVLAALLLPVGCGADVGPAAPSPSDPAPAPSTPVSARPTPSPVATRTEAATDQELATASPSSRPSSGASAGPTPGLEVQQLPRGGTRLFPRYQLVGYAGLTGSPALGRLGIGRLDARMAELEERAQPYARGREVLPVMEMIATIVQADPGRDGKYRTRASDATIARYLREARAANALLLLNIQPGRAGFLDEVRAYDRWLAEPDVGLALDPEWAMGPGQVPGRSFGQTTGGVIDDVARHVSRIVAERDLPEKVVVYHQLTPGIVRDERRLREREGVVLVKSVDGIGVRAAKEATYRRVNASTPDFVHPGFKIFYEEDADAGPLMTPRQVLALDPVPDYVMYE